MPNPNTQWCAVLVDPGGAIVGHPLFFSAKNEARDGSKDMLRRAPDARHSVAIFKQAARMDMTAPDFTVTDT